MDLTHASQEGRRRMPVAHVSRTDGEVVCRLGGEFDIGTVDALRDALAHAGSLGEPRVVVDLSDVTFMDTSGLQTLLEFREILGGQGRWLRTRRAQPQVARLLELARAQYGILI